MSSKGQDQGLELSTGKKRSRVYDYFHKSENGEFYICNLCVKFSSKVPSDSSTGALLKHIREKHGTEYKEIEDSLQRGKKLKSVDMEEERGPLTRDGFLDKLIKFIVDCDQPYSLVENEAFQDFINYISKDETATKLPGRTFITEKISKKFQEEKSSIQALIRETSSQVSLVLDCWTSSNQIPFMGVICRFVDNQNKLHTLPLDLIEIQGPHTGENLVHALLPVLDDFCLTDKIVSITTDNASNMDTFFRHFEDQLSDKGIVFNEEHQRVRCLPHILNLSATALLENVEENVVPVGMIRDAIRAIRGSPQRRAFFFRQCKEDGEKLLPILDCKVRWNSTYDMLERALVVKKPLCATLSLHPDLTGYSITEEGWSAIEKLLEILSPIKKATLSSSKSCEPSIANSTMIYQNIFSHFDKYLERRQRIRAREGETNSAHTWIKRAVQCAKDKLENYYGTSGGKAHVIGIVLHPSFKLQWFKQVKWPEAWIGHNKALVEGEWEEKYKCSTDSTNLATASEGSADSDQLYHQQMRGIEMKDELQKYLKAPTVDIKVIKSTGLLNWWKMHESQFPMLLKMARNYLAVSGSGVPVECLFSSITDILTDNRQRLSADHIKELICLKKWQQLSSRSPRDKNIISVLLEDCNSAS